jgi:hypothetical protein
VAGKKRKGAGSVTSKTGGKMCPNPGYKPAAPILAPKPKQLPRVRILMPDQRGRIA